jgi:hypothetical protein
MKLTEKILEIINNKIELSLNSNYQSAYIDGKDNAAEEITALIENEYYPKDFIFWYLRKGQFELRSMDFEEGAYKFWLKNVKEK